MVTKTISLFSVLLISLTTQAHSQIYRPTCPTMLEKLLGTDVDCTRLECITSLSPKDCKSNNTYVEVYTEKAAQCGCCPACIGTETRSEGSECTKTYFKKPEDEAPSRKKVPWPVIKIQCNQGTYCSRETGLCELIPENTAVLTCDQMRGMYNTYDENKLRKFHWQPNCAPDGSFSPVQCKGNPGAGDAFCFCSTPTGNRIFGQTRYFSDTPANVTCACSLHRWRLQQQEILTTIHCQANGNYEPLQCDGNSGLCYCVDEKTGTIQGEVVLEKDWTNLPCFDKTKMTNKYLRFCDSVQFATEKIREEAKAHGVGPEVLTQLTTHVCDYDGSYAPYRLFNGQDACVSKVGDTIGSYTRPRSNAPKPTCFCARDIGYFEQEDIEFPPYRGTCISEGDVGSYPLAMNDGESGYCLDRDGFLYNKVSIELFCCLLDDIDEDCEDTDFDQSQCGAQGIRKCSQIDTGSPK